MLALLGLPPALAAFSGDPEPARASAPGLVNPASEHCLAQGGQLRVETAGDGGQYGVCLFEDNRQCEEWALLRGDCPLGGIRVTGYVTPQARYCAIRGGDYVVTREQTATSSEEGTCTLPVGLGAMPSRCMKAAAAERISAAQPTGRLAALLDDVLRTGVPRSWGVAKEGSARPAHGL